MSVVVQYTTTKKRGDFVNVFVFAFIFLMALYNLSLRFACPKVFLESSSSSEKAGKGTKIEGRLFGAWLLRESSSV